MERNRTPLYRHGNLFFRSRKRHPRRTPPPPEDAALALIPTKSTEPRPNAPQIIAAAHRAGFFLLVNIGVQTLTKLNICPAGLLANVSIRTGEEQAKRLVKLSMTTCQNLSFFVMVQAERPPRRASRTRHSVRHTARHFLSRKAQIRHIPAVSRVL